MKNNSPILYVNKIKENWIVDRVKDEWISSHSLHTRFSGKSDIIWLIAPWLWTKEKKRHLKSKKVVCSIYHLDENKFDKNQLNEFVERDKYVDYYHVISTKTLHQIKHLTDKKIYNIPYWVNSNLSYEIKNKDNLINNYNIPKGKFLIGSFQRDTEGHDLASPKLSKGPDRFIEIVDYLNKKMENLHVILAGQRRQYVINELNKRKIDFTYFRMATNVELNNLYNLLDLYIVGSRFEGGPQAIFECAVTKTPIISTDVGVASEILHSNSIFDMNNFMNAEPNIEYAFSKVQKFLIPEGFIEFENMFQEIYEN